MRPGFESALRQYGEVIKDIRKTEKGEHVAPDVELHDLEVVANYYISKRSSELEVGRPTQEEIFDLQREKQRVMERLKARLRRIDDPKAPEGEQPKDSMVARYDQKRNIYIVKDHQGRTHEVTFGEMVADAMWGLSYCLGEDAPRVHRKEYVVAQAKNSLRLHLDRQICLEEMERKDHAKNIFGGAYVPFLQRLEGMNFPELTMSGWWAEEMVCGFLTRLAIDGIADIQIRKADVYQDINNTMDFSIRRRDYLRGVDTCVREKGIGIQFTLQHNEWGLEKKKRKVEGAKKRLEEVHMDDLVLVSVPITDEIIVSMRQWRQEGCPPGSPMRFWSQETKKAIIGGVLQNLFSSGELRQMETALEAPFKQTVQSKKEPVLERSIKEVDRYFPKDLRSDRAFVKEATNVLRSIQSVRSLEGCDQEKERLCVRAVARLVRRHHVERGGWEASA